MDENGLIVEARAATIMHQVQPPAPELDLQVIQEQVEMPPPGPRRLSLRGNFAWTFLGNGIYAACQWGMLVLLAKLGSPEEVGKFALGLAITAPIMMATNLQLRGVQATDAKRDYSFGDYLALRLLMTVLAMVMVVAIVLVGRYSMETGGVILLVGLAKSFESISDVFYGLLQSHERMDRIAVSMMIKGGLSLAAMGVAFIVTGSIVWAAVGLVLSWALILGTYDMRSGRLVHLPAGRAGNGSTTTKRKHFEVFDPDWNLKRLTRLAWLALPLGLVMMLGSLNANIPRYFIEHDLGSRDLGFFAALAYLMTAGAMIGDALGQSASPRLAQYYALSNLRAFRRLLLKLAVLLGCIGALGIVISLLAGRPILSALYRSEYGHYSDLLVWLTVASGFIWVGGVVGYGLTAARSFHSQLPLSIAVTATTVLGCIVLVPHYHLLGAAYATVLAALVKIIAGTPILIRVIGGVLRKNARREPLGPSPQEG